MNITSLLSLFKKKQKTLELLDSLLVKKIELVSKIDELKIYKNITIYHHKESYFIPLLILDKKRGVFLFEHKEWSYDVLKNSTLSKASEQDSSESSIAYEKTHKFIKQKLNELIHRDDLPIYNYLLLENLNEDEYQHLHSSFRELLPLSKTIFSDSKEQDILKKLQKAPLLKEPIANEADIMGNLLVQYLILSKDKTLNLVTQAQAEFIDSKLQKLTTLSGLASSGKTNSILLKSILESLRDPSLKTIIIEPSRLACDLLKQKILNIIEYSIVELDLSSIEVITPIDLVNRHLSKLKKVELKSTLNIDKKLMKRSFKAADLIICDDSELLSMEFIEYLKHIQKKSSLILVDGYSEQKRDFKLERSFKTKAPKPLFIQENQHAKALQTISTLLKSFKASEILVVAKDLSRKKLLEDLDGFIDDRVLVVDSSLSLLSQDLDGLLLSTYSDIASLTSKAVVLMDVENISLNQIQYALSLAREALYVIYDKECQNIKTLKEKNE